MSLEEFVSKLPTSIVHNQYGHGELKTLCYMKESCIAWYTHYGSRVTAVSFGKTWDEVYSDIQKFLSENDSKGNPRSH